MRFLGDGTLNCFPSQRKTFYFYLIIFSMIFLTNVKTCHVTFSFLTFLKGFTIRDVGLLLSTNVNNSEQMGIPETLNDVGDHRAAITNNNFQFEAFCVAFLPHICFHGVIFQRRAKRRRRCFPALPSAAFSSSWWIFFLSAFVPPWPFCHIFSSVSCFRFSFFLVFGIGFLFLLPSAAASKSMVTTAMQTAGGDNEQSCHHQKTPQRNDHNFIYSTAKCLH